MKRLRIISIVFALLWVIGVNHCAIADSLFAAFPNANQSKEDCHSHSSEAPDSHNEGSPCEIQAIPTFSQNINNFQPQLALIIPSDFISVLLTDSYQEKVTKPDRDYLIDTIKPQAILSFSIASNAPPIAA